MVDVEFTVALKAPRGTHAQFTGSAYDGWQYDARFDINAWLASQLNADDWTGWVLYNDEPPGEAERSGGGHCKGIVAWTEEKVGWMIHSVPKWPDTFGTEQLPEIRPAECEYGQSFVWLTLPIQSRDDILGQIRLMQAHVYEDTHSQHKPRQRAPTADKQLQTIQLSQNVFHIGKHSKWGMDLYEDGIVPVFKGNWVTETWSRPGQPPTKRVGRVGRVRWARPSPAITYNDDMDHSKWAVSCGKKSNHMYSYIGDINAMESQFHRGGGGVVIRDANLWKALSDLIITRS